MIICWLFLSGSVCADWLTKDEWDMSKKSERFSILNKLLQFSIQAPKERENKFWVFILVKLSTAFDVLQDELK